MSNFPNHEYDWFKDPAARRYMETMMENEKELSVRMIFSNAHYYTEKPIEASPIFLFMSGYQDNIAWALTGQFKDGEYVGPVNSKLIGGLDFSHWCYLKDGLHEITPPTPEPPSDPAPQGGDLCKCGHPKTGKSGADIGHGINQEGDSTYCKVRSCKCEQYRPARPPAPVSGDLMERARVAVACYYGHQFTDEVIAEAMVAFHLSEQAYRQQSASQMSAGGDVDDPVIFDALYQKARQYCKRDISGAGWESSHYNFVIAGMAGFAQQETQSLRQERDRMAVELKEAREAREALGIYAEKGHWVCPDCLPGGLPHQHHAQRFWIKTTNGNETANEYLAKHPVESEGGKDD